FMSITDGENIFFTLYPSMLVGMITFTLQSYDEREKWQTFSSAFPLSRKTLVSSKYLFCLIACGSNLVFTSVTYSVATLVIGSFSLETFFSNICAMFSVALVTPSILMPIVYRFGAVKGKALYYVVLGIFWGAIAILNNISGKGYKLSLSPPLYIVSIVVAILFVLSWLLSVKLFEKRDL
ncbi:MAG: ABC-2 transporter permease, partial [Clostridiales bacterium]|nr:ABC-2 transporter permease [Clostridiales bacterium]